MIHPHTELRFINPEMGYGVVATRFIPKGTITWAFDLLDRVYAPEAIEGMSPPYKEIMDKYCYREQTGNFIFCWDNARFVNHSFHSNCISTAYNFELAVRDIYPGEELTDDYGYLNCREPFSCLPEANTARTHVMPDDLLHFYNEWDAKLVRAFEHYDKVEQPLLSLLPSNIQKKAAGIAKGLDEMDSILNCFYSDSAPLMQVKEKLLHSGSNNSCLRKAV